MKKYFDNMPLMIKVALAPALVLACLLLVSLYSQSISRETSRTLEQLTQRNMTDLILVAEVQERVVATNAMVMQSVAYAGAKLKPEIIQSLDQKIASEFKAAQAKIGELQTVLASEPQAASRMARVDAAFKKYTKAAGDSLDMKDADLYTAAIMISAAETAYGETRKLLQEQFDAEVAQAKQSGDQATEGLSVGSKASMTVTVGALLISMLLTWLIARAIVRPLQSAVELAQEVASGNLGSRSTQAGADETGQVLLTLDKVTERLNVLMAEIRGGAEQIDIAVGEISMGNTDLANRTEQTSVAIQATSSSIAQLADTIQVNSQTAVQANQLATDATQVAAQGGVAVTEVVNTMSAISMHARRISEIIGTIDSIAFQTNILALNAAVEAARAGEQGRGFAVVASEVRVLAQRSAAASKEIRTLIGASVEQVESGTTKVHAAGETMRRIVDAIERVSSMVAEISRATSEQADSIHRVNDSVSDIERNTQQNAALVEQSAAASESLRVQSAGLVQAVSFFRTT